MKHLFVITVFLYANFLIAQDIPLEQRAFTNINNFENPYFKDVNGRLDKFLGVWKFVDATTSFEIEVFKNIEKQYVGYKTDQIYVKFKLVKNGTVVYDYLNSTDESLKIWISGGIVSNNLNKCEMLYLEPTDIQYTRSSAPTLFLTHSFNLSLPGGTGGAQEILQWELNYGKQRSSDPWPFKIPSSMTLVKQ